MVSDKYHYMLMINVMIVGKSLTCNSHDQVKFKFKIELEAHAHNLSPIKYRLRLLNNTAKEIEIFPGHIN